MKISVITAVYNSEATIGEAIRSVASQSWEDIEHIIIEGCSKDNSLQVIESENHTRMRLISEPDKGIYDALNKGIRASSGDVVGFLHSDDYFPHKDVLSRIAKAFEDPAVEAVFGDLDYIDKIDTNRVIRHWSTGPFNRRKLKFGWMPAHPTLYMRRSVYERIGGYDDSFSISADYEFILRYFSQSESVTVYIPDVLYKMRVGGVSNRNLSKIKKKMCEDFIALRRHKVGGVMTLMMKSLTKISQFIKRD